MTTDDLPASPAQAYQDYFAPAIFEPLADRVLGVRAPAAGDRVLDVACGTGILTRRLAAAVGETGRAVGVDINPMMIEVAVAVTDPGLGIAYRVGDGAALGLPTDELDAVYCQQGLQFFPDRAAGIAEMRRVLHDDGVAVVAVWQGLEAHPLYAALIDAEEPHLAALGVEVSRDELAAPFSLGDPDELTGLFRTAGFGDVSVVPVAIEARFADADRFVHRMEFAYAAVVPQFAADPTAFATYLEAIQRDTRDVVEAHRRGAQVVTTMHANVAVAR
jgi:SAM-dependent methyltransferase